MERKVRKRALFPLAKIHAGTHAFIILNVSRKRTVVLTLKQS